MLIGLVGKPSSGKSSFFKALTMVDVKIASYPFTTIEPNRGVAFVKTPCPCKEYGKICNPNNSQCENGIRFIPVKILDVAGLVPGAHTGKGKGNKFLDDLRQADALIYIVDMSGKTDENGLPTENYDPLRDIGWLEEEIEMWILGIIEKASGKKMDAELIIKQLSGFSGNDNAIRDSVKDAGENLRKLSMLVRERTKPMMIAANKMDLQNSHNNLDKALNSFQNKVIVPCSAEMEIVIKLAGEKGMIKFDHDNGKLSVTDSVTPQQKEALQKIQDFIEEYDSTGIQKCLDKTVFELLEYIDVYPVENENTWADSKGRVLPDVYLVPKGTTAKEFAGFVHTDFLEKFIAAIDAKRKMRIKEDYELKKGDIIKIVIGK